MGIIQIIPKTMKNTYIKANMIHYKIRLLTEGIASAYYNLLFFSLS